MTVLLTYLNKKEVKSMIIIRIIILATIIFGMAGLLHILTGAEIRIDILDIIKIVIRE